MWKRYCAASNTSVMRNAIRYRGSMRPARCHQPCEVVALAPSGCGVSGERGGADALVRGCVPASFMASFRSASSSGLHDRMEPIDRGVEQHLLSAGRPADDHTVGGLVATEP